MMPVIKCLHHFIIISHFPTLPFHQVIVNDDDNVDVDDDDVNDDDDDDVDDDDDDGGGDLSIKSLVNGSSR